MKLVVRGGGRRGKEACGLGEGVYVQGWGTMLSRRAANLVTLFQDCLVRLIQFQQEAKGQAGIEKIARARNMFTTRCILLMGQQYDHFLRFTEPYLCERRIFVPHTLLMKRDPDQKRWKQLLMCFIMSSSIIQRDSGIAGVVLFELFCSRCLRH